MSRTFPFPAFPNGWFQVAYSDEVKPGDVIPLHYFGKHLVLFRGENGEAKVLDAYCPHLGAHLGYGGKVKGELLECPFHSWRFDGSGQCAEIPYATKIPAKAKIPCWPVNEINGLIMVWHHLEGQAPTWEVPAIPEYNNEEWTPYEKRRWKIKTCNQEMAENQVDQAHFKYVHGAANLPQASVETRGHIMHMKAMTIMTTPGGEVQGNVDSIAHGFGFALNRFTGLVETLLVASQTQIDEESIDVRFSFSVKKMGGRSLTAGVGKAFVAEVTRQLEQDIPIWENKIYITPPVLCDGDGPVGMFRKWCKQFYSYPQGEGKQAEKLAS